MAFRMNVAVPLALEFAIVSRCRTLALPSEPLMLAGPLVEGHKSTATRGDKDNDGGSLSARPEILSAVQIPSRLTSSTSLLNRDPSEGLTNNCPGAH